MFYITFCYILTEINVLFVLQTSALNNLGKNLWHKFKTGSIMDQFWVLARSNPVKSLCYKGYLAKQLKNLIMHVFKHVLKKLFSVGFKHTLIVDSVVKCFRESVLKHGEFIP